MATSAPQTTPPTGPQSIPIPTTASVAQSATPPALRPTRTASDDVTTRLSAAFSIPGANTAVVPVSRGPAATDVVSNSLSASLYQPASTTAPAATGDGNGGSTTVKAVALGVGLGLLLVLVGLFVSRVMFPFHRGFRSFD